MQSREGREFEYCVQNQHDLLVPHKIEDILKKKSEINSLAADEARGGDMSKGGAGSNWLQDPSGRDKTVASYVEIVSSTDFDRVNDRMYINYQLYLPSVGWDLRLGDTSDGVPCVKRIEIQDARGPGNSRVQTTHLNGTTQITRASLDADVRMMLPG